MSENISVSRVIPAKPERIYTAWLSGAEHGKMTGSTATYDSDAFTAWDGYISGKTLEKVPCSKIVQAWRTTEFPDEAPDSKLTVMLEPAVGGTKVTIEQDVIPDGQGESYESGWHEHYFDPMTTYFSSVGSKLKDAGEAVEEAAERAGDMIEHAVEEASEQVGDAARQALKAVDKARSNAKKQALKAVKNVKKVQKKAVAQAKKLGKRVKAFVGKKKGKVAKKKAPGKKKTAKRARKR